MNKGDYSKYTKRSIRSLQPYQAKEMPCKVKLDANESPYRPLEETMDKLSGIPLNRYPDPGAKELRKTIARDLKIAPDEILMGNGSDELIYYLIIAFGGPVLFPVPTFSMYGIISRALGEEHIGIPLDKDFDIDTGKMLAAVKKHKPKLVFLSSPNNPTGNCFSSDRILKIVEQAKGIVVVDEAYQPFSSDKGFVPLLKDYPNMAVLRTLSKIGFAALRVGFLLGDKGLVREVNKVRLPFNLNALSQAAALEGLRDRRAIQSHVKAIASERERMFRELDAMPGINPYPSEANFILFSTDNAHALYLKLIRSGILVRDMSGAIRNALRVTIGTPEQNNFFIEALKKATGRKK